MNDISVSGAAANVAGGITLYGVLDYFSISGEALAILSVLLMLDFIMGITDAYIQDRTSVTSTKMWRGLAKKITRRLLPFIIVAIFRGAGIEDMSTTVGMVLSILVITEGYSIIGHIYSINTGKTIPEIDAFELLLNWIMGIFKGKLPEKKDEEK